MNMMLTANKQHRPTPKPENSIQVVQIQSMRSANIRFWPVFKHTAFARCSLQLAPGFEQRDRAKNLL